jgi:catechol 2,3-dioxygenase-like lactoylglutathione lyase family enzyme
VKQFFLGIVIMAILGFDPQTSSDISIKHSNSKEKSNMQLGNFSISLAVKDLQASKAFYEKLGFRLIHGEPKANWVIMQNETCTIGLFQGMFDKNTLTFNPGWDRSGKTLSDYTDVREIQKELKSIGITPVVAADETTKGPAFLTLVDPDGNPVLIDQHAPTPESKE